MAKMVKAQNMNRIPELDAAIRELAQAAAGDLDDHPSAADLAAYGVGQLDSQKSSALAQHLLGCRECAALVADFAGFQGDGFALSPPSELELATAWQGLQHRLETARATPKTASPAASVIPFKSPGQPDQSPRSRQLVPLQALAASLLVACLGLLAWTWHAQQQLTRLKEPQLNVPVMDLYPQSNARSEGDVQASIATGGEVVLLVLHVPPTDQVYSDHQVTITRANGDLLFASRGLVPNEFGSFSLALPRLGFPPGTYAIRLSAHPQGQPLQEAWLGDYELVIAAP